MFAINFDTRVETAKLVIFSRSISRPVVRVDDRYQVSKLREHLAYDGLTRTELQ